MKARESYSSYFHELYERIRNLLYISQKNSKFPEIHSKEVSDFIIRGHY